MNQASLAVWAYGDYVGCGLLLFCVVGCGLLSSKLWPVGWLRNTVWAAYRIGAWPSICQLRFAQNSYLPDN
uniref:Uncharacterized protein n=1 Tax=Arundo donax TaxID=35708 RepID=A0A0A9FYK7_ARUDO